jgi:hypothetical protein
MILIRAAAVLPRASDVGGFCTDSSIHSLKTFAMNSGRIESKRTSMPSVAFSFLSILMAMRAECINVRRRLPKMYWRRPICRCGQKPQLRASKPVLKVNIRSKRLRNAFAAPDTTAAHSSSTGSPAFCASRLDRHVGIGMIACRRL